MLPRYLHQGLQNILAPVPPAFLIRPLPHLPLGNLSPVVSPGSPLHLSYRHRAAASCLSATVSSPASCRTASVGVLLSIPDIILAALSWVRSSLSLLVLEIQGPLAGAAYSSKLPRSQCRRDALPPQPAQIRTSQPHKEVVSGRLSPRDADLLVVGATQEL